MGKHLLILFPNRVSYAGRAIEDKSPQKTLTGKDYCYIFLSDNPS